MFQAAEELPKGAGAAALKTGLEGTVQGLVDSGTAYNETFKSKVATIGQGLEIVHGPVKTFERAMEKVIEEYGGDIRGLRDLNRSALLVENPLGSFANILSRIKAQFPVERVKNNIDNDFYRAIIVNVKTEPGHIAEIQLVTPKMWDAKINGGGDQLYHSVRKKLAGWEADQEKMYKLYFDAR